MADLAGMLAISERALMDEREAVAALLTQVAPMASLEGQILSRAERWTQHIRGGAHAGIESFLHTYGLDTREGVALMCLAEALLRIPDAATADRLIHNTFEGKDWRRPLAGDEPWLVNASSWGLLLTGKVVDFGQEGTGLSGALGGAVARIGEPVIRQALKQAMRFIGTQFVLGEGIEEALSHAQPLAQKGFRFSYDILGEGARSDAQALHYVSAYHDAVARIASADKDGSDLFSRPNLSVKLSALHPRYSLSQEKRVMTELHGRLHAILALARTHNLTVSIDAEEAARLDIELMLFADIIGDPAFAGWNGIGFVLQSYQKRAFYLVDWLAELAKKHGRVIPVRLVKGAYWDSEIKLAQLAGLSGYPVFTRKEHTDLSYLACADKLLAARGCFFPQFATHNARTAATILALSERYGMAADGFEFQRLHGMGEALHALISETHKVRIYAPVGAHRDLLAYLIRRLLENGANTSFVNLLMDPDTSMNELLADPVERARRHGGEPNEHIPLPEQLYAPARKNSRGIDLGYLAEREKLREQLIRHAGIKDTLRLEPFGKIEVENAVARAAAAFPQWSQTSVDARARMLESAADLLESRAPAAIALLVGEAGKTIADAVSEVREAADFCRYYAMQARRLMQPEPLPGPTGESNLLTLHPRGVFGCISPWNFPLAIFTGQVVAALVTGNCALAKPAEQTPRIAAFMVSLLHEAGVPQDALQLITGRGSVVGAALTEDERVGGIVFTGSVEVAQAINRSLAAREGPIVPFIAETGGQNAMIVDSSALPEQAIDDVLLSAFGSAGQRCSALRVLFVQEEIAAALIELLSGAMAELALGDPMDVATDIGPVIGAAARQSLLTHIEQMKRSAKFIASAPLPPALQGHFVAPHAFEIKSIRELEGEVFGPVLHVVRYKSGELRSVVDDINATGFGLTFGIQSRVQGTVDFLTARVHAGNRYVNRSMIGAVVGVQPFGGEGLSGTGPKAGGPHYLLRFISERTLTVNTAAIGGNVSLLSAE